MKDVGNDKNRAVDNNRDALLNGTRAIINYANSVEICDAQSAQKLQNIPGMLHAESADGNILAIMSEPNRIDIYKKEKKKGEA